VRGEPFRPSRSAADDEQADDEDEDDELEGDPDGVLEAALQAGVADGDPYGEGEQASDHQEHAELARDEAAHDKRPSRSVSRGEERRPRKIGKRA
jgi:hypothetical protein